MECQVENVPEANGRPRYAATNSSAGGSADARTDPAGGAPDAARSLRVVIVEDEAFIRLDIEHALLSEGHQVVATAVDADQAVAVVGRERPDVVLMDIRIVGARDGVDAALEIRRNFDIACIVISAHVDAASQARLAPARPLAILTKPVDFSLLERELSRV